MKPFNKPKTGRSATRLLLLALALSLPSCAQKLAVPSSYPQIPAPPPLSEPLPSVSYSESAAKSIQRWRQRLMPTPQMQPPSSQPGPITGNSKPISKPSKTN